MKKQYIKLIVFNSIFFLIYMLGMIWERQFEDARNYGGLFVWSFYPVLFVYLIFYGCYSYIKTKRVVVPNLLLLLFLVLYFVWLIYLSPLSNKTAGIADSYKILLLSGLITGVSVGFSLLTKLICFSIKRQTKPSGEKDS